MGSYQKSTTNEEDELLKAFRSQSTTEYIHKWTPLEPSTTVSVSEIVTTKGPCNYIYYEIFTNLNSDGKMFLVFGHKKKYLFLLSWSNKKDKIENK